MNMINTQRKVIFVAVATAISAISIQSYAADNVQAHKPALEEVLVEAQKRTENVLDIPVAITAISAETLEKADIKSTQDAVRLAPTLTLNEGANKQVSSFSIRGVGTSVYGIGVEQGVAVVVDDVAAAQPGQTMAGLMDIERIEVLRGPQSTLFGKSASAGALNIVTKAPSSAPEGSIELTGTNDHEKRVAGSVSAPITDSIGFRLSGLWSDREGFIENLTPGQKDKNGDKTSNFRGKLRWEISDNVVMDLGAYYVKDDANCCVRTFKVLDPTARLLGFIPGFAQGIQAGVDNAKVRADGGPDSTSKTQGANVRFNIDIGEFTLTSITAVDYWKYYNTEEVDFSDLDINAILTGGARHGGWSSTSTIETDFFSQELRLVSPLFDKYEYLIGAYYSDANTDQTFFRNMLVAPADNDTSAETKNVSLFGQLTWHFTDATSVTGGLRWSKEDISAASDNRLAPAGHFAGSDSESPVVGRLSLQHKLDEDTLLYASYARGYKGQAFDISGGLNAYKAANPVKSEHSNAYEVGVKSTLLDRRLQLSADVFKATYTDFQVQRTEQINGVAVFALNNVGELDTKGVELETVGLLTDDLSLTFNAAYVDAAVNNYIAAACWPGQTAAQGCTVSVLGNTQNIDGGRLVASPEWKFTTMLDYQMPMASMPFDGFANIVYTWQDAVQFNIDQNPRLEQGAYGLANLRVGLNDHEDHYRLTLFVNNIFDKHYSSSMSDPQQIYGGKNVILQTQARNSQRYWGVSAQYKF